MGYKTDCPQCGGTNFYVTEHNGLGHCFNPECRYTDRSINGEVERRSPDRKIRSPHLAEIREYYTKMAAYYHSNLTKPSIQYLYQRGYNDTTIQELQLGYCPPEDSLLYRNEIATDSGLATYNGKAFLADRITFPYIAKKGLITDIRGRSLDAHATVRYKSPLGGAYYRGSDYPYNYFLRQSDMIVITEGEIKSGIGLQCGYNVLSIPGITNWKEGFRQWNNQKIVLLFDTESENSRAIRQAIIKIEQFLSNVYVATLPLYGESKMDIDSYIPKYGKESFDLVIRSAIPFRRWLQLQRRV